MGKCWFVGSVKEFSVLPTSPPDARASDATRETGDAPCYVVCTCGKQCDPPSSCGVYNHRCFLYFFPGCFLCVFLHFLPPLVVGSMNLSIEALGQFVQGRYDTYSFEVGVALSPIEASSDAPWVVIELAPDGGLGPPVRDIGSLWTNDGTNKRFCRRKKKKKKILPKKKKKKKKKS